MNIVVPRAGIPLEAGPGRIGIVDDHGPTSDSKKSLRGRLSVSPYDAGLRSPGDLS